jgi:predicted lysophospholipase L1 biosynthesis ABC-type transport system permease subunit
LHGNTLRKRARQVTGVRALGMAIERAGHNIIHGPVRSTIIAGSVAAGIAIAIAIVAASNGVDDKVNSLLNVGPLPTLIKLDTIQKVLDQTRDTLTGLAFAFTAVLVGLVTWVTMNQRRREIGIARQHGLHVSEVLTELLIEASILCLVGGFVGIGCSSLLCNSIQQAIPLLPMHPKAQDILSVFPVVTGLSFGATALIASYFAIRTYTDVI